MSGFYNFADENIIISIAFKIINDLQQTVEQEWKFGIDWFVQNKMIVNLDEFQVMLQKDYIQRKIS